MSVIARFPSIEQVRKVHVGRRRRDRYGSSLRYDRRDRCARRSDERRRRPRTLRSRGIPDARVGVECRRSRSDRLRRRIPPGIGLRTHPSSAPAAGFVFVLGGTVSVELATPNPEWSTLDGYVIVDGPTHVASYANTWYVWLSLLLVAGGLEFAIRRGYGVGDDRLRNLPRSRSRDRSWRGRFSVSEHSSASRPRCWSFGPAFARRSPRSQFWRLRPSSRRSCWLRCTLVGSSRRRSCSRCSCHIS